MFTQFHICAIQKLKNKWKKKTEQKRKFVTLRVLAQNKKSETVTL